MEKTLENGFQKPSWWSWPGEDLQLQGFSRELLRAAAAELGERFDQEKGGFAGLTEEQEVCAALFLLEYARRAEEGWALAMAGAALERRNRTGAPLLAYANLEAYAQTGRSVCLEAAREMLDGMLRTLRLPGGGFSEHGDGTVSTAWNAQAIAALAKACRVLGDASYLRAAVEARLFLKTRLTQPNGRLWRRWQERTPMEEGRLADYGFYCWALLELYEADFAVSCLREAEGLADRMMDIFRDQEGGLYDFDGEASGGRGAAGLALSGLARLTGIPRYRTMAREQLAWLAGTASEFPEGLALLGMTEELFPRRELICASAGAIPPWLAPVGEEYRLTVLAKTPENSRGLENAVPGLREYPTPESGLRLYLCRDGACESAAEDLEQLYRQVFRKAVTA